MLIILCRASINCKAFAFLVAHNFPHIFLVKLEFGAHVANLRKTISKMLVRRIQLFPRMMKAGGNGRYKYCTSLHKGEKNVSMRILAEM